MQRRRGVLDKDAMAAESSHIFGPLSQAQVAAIGEQGGVVFVVGVEQGRMRAMGMREGAARSEFQAMPAVVTCPQSRSEEKKEGDES